MTAPSPSKNVKPSNIHGVTTWSSVSTPNAPEASTIQPCVISIKRRRSTMSARAPAGRITRNTGNATAACTSPTINGDMVSMVIIQPAPTACIHVPMYEMMAAIHRARNRGSRNGAHAEPPCSLGTLEESGGGVFTISAILDGTLQNRRAWSKRPFSLPPGTRQVN